MDYRRNAFLSGLLTALLAGVVWAMPAGAPSGAGPDAIKSTTGSLAIQAIQGTPGGPPIGAIGVEVSLLTQNKVIQTINTELDEHGIVVLDDIPIDISVQPVIRIQHAGVTYQEVGQIMGLEHPQQAVKVTCYEVTTDIPQWLMSMRQVMLSYAPGGIKVTEIMVVMNPEQHTWLGTPNPPNKPITMSLDLPRSAKQVKLGTGFHDWCCTSLEAGALINHLPMMPHVSELDFSYIIETDNGTFDLEIIAPARVEQMVVMLPDDMHAHSVDGLALGGTRQIANTMVRYYTAADLPKGNSVRLSLSGLPTVPVLPAQTTQSIPAVISSDLLILILGGVVILLAAVATFVRYKSR